MSAEKIELTPEEEEKLREEFDRQLELKKQWLLEECLSSRRQLDISAKKLDDLDALTVAFYLHDCKFDLKLFHIGANNFTDKGLIDMLSGLQWHSNIEEIYIGNNQFSEIGVSTLIELIPSFPNLKILSMGNCGVTDQNMISLTYQLSEIKNLTSLSLQSNQIGDFGLISLSSLLTANILQKFRVLHIGDNPLTNFAIKNFFDALQKNTTLKIIYMNDIALEIQSIQSLAECLEKNQIIEELNLGNTGFSDVGASILWGSLKKSKLKVLQLWNNYISDESLLEFAEIIEQGHLELNYIGLQDNEIKDMEFVKDLNEILKWKNKDEKQIKLKSSNANKQQKQNNQENTTKDSSEEQQTQKIQDLEDLDSQGTKIDYQQ